MKATVGWTDRRFLVAGVPGQSAQLRREEVATWRDFALWYTVVTEVEDGMGGGGGGHLRELRRVGRAGPDTGSPC
jgi:hypothetical protein